MQVGSRSERVVLLAGFPSMGIRARTSFFNAGVIDAVISNTELRSAAVPAVSSRLPWQALAWVAVAVAFLLPVWCFPYFPTQDGAAHLANAVILRDYLRGDARVQAFYWINWQPLPNWACTALLASLSWVLPPLVAEKVLISLYVVGFAGAYRYFVGSLGRNAGLLSLVGFLFTFNYCLWMGFYNYCLSLVGYFIIIGYLLRRWEAFRQRDAFVLCAMFGIVYLTHIFGFLLAAMSCFWLAVAVPPRGWRKSAYVMAALAPSLVMALSFFHQARYVEDGVFSHLRDHSLGWIQGNDQWQRLVTDLTDLEGHLFGIYLDRPVTLGMGLWLLCWLFILAGLWNIDESTPKEKARRGAVAALGALIALLYFLLPHMLVPDKGDYWKSRLAPLPPLLWLAWVRLPSSKAICYALTVTTAVLLAVDLGQVTLFVRNVNRDLREFTSGLEAAGRKRVVVFHIVADRMWWVEPLRHAGDYYCLNSHNINLGPHFASLLHSVVRLRPGLKEVGENAGIENDPQHDLVDVIVVWDKESNPPLPQGFTLAFRQGSLKVLHKDTNTNQ